MTYGTSPKAIAAAVTAIVVYVVAEVGLDLPEPVVAALELLLTFAFAWLAHPGDVAVNVGPPSDALLDHDALGADGG